MSSLHEQHMQMVDAVNTAEQPVPRRPWVASQQYGMRFILSADNEIVVRADHLPLEVLRIMAEAVTAAG